MCLFYLYHSNAGWMRWMKSVARHRPLLLPRKLYPTCGYQTDPWPDGANHHNRVSMCVCTLLARMKDKSRHTHTLHLRWGLGSFFDRIDPADSWRTSPPHGLVSMFENGERSRTFGGEVDGSYQCRNKCKRKRERKEIRNRTLACIYTYIYMFYQWRSGRYVFIHMICKEMDPTIFSWFFGFSLSCARAKK